MRSHPKIAAASIIVRNDEPVAVEVDGSVVMMSLEKSMYYGLEGVGGRIWHMVDRPRSVAEICVELAAEYDVEPEVCLRDVCDFVDQLVRSDLIRIMESSRDPVDRRESAEDGSPVEARVGPAES
jgi:Coenzyme PQQ synthesis protein D (PqqD)